MVGGMVGQIEVREMRRKRYKSPSPVLDRRSFADRSGFALSVRRQTGRSFCLRGTCWRTTRMSSGVRVLWPGVASGWCPVGWCFPSCQNCLIKRTHWAHPVWTRGFLLSAGAPSRGAGMLRTGVIRHFDVTLRLATPDIRLASADAFAVVGGGCTGKAHGCKAKQGRRGKDGADVWFLLPQ